MVPDFRKVNWEGFVGKMNNLNWEHLFQGKNTYEMWDIFKSLLNKFTKQFISMKKIRNNEEVKPKWMIRNLKDLLEKLKYHSRPKKQIHQKKISRDIGRFYKARKGKLGKVRDCEIKAVNSVTDSKTL